MSLDEIVADVDFYISMFIRNSLREVYINGNKVPLEEEYTFFEYDPDEKQLKVVDASNKTVIWNVSDLVEKVVKEKGKEWYKMSDKEKEEYVAGLFVYNDED